jgi:hypothetical protein
MTENLSEEEKMEKYNFHEVYIRVWNPETRDSVTSLTLDIYGDEETLDSIHSQLYNNLNRYVDSEGEEMSGIQELVARNLNSLIKKDMIMDAECGSFNINDVETLERALKTGHMEPHL